MANNESRLAVEKGRIIIYRLFDAAFEIDLAMVERTAREGTKRLKFSKYPYTRAIEIADPPVSLELAPFSKCLFGRDVKVGVIAKAYDFGVISIAFDMPIPEGTSFAALEEAARQLDTDASIDSVAMEYVVQLLETLGKAAVKPGVKEGFVEDYAIIYVERLSEALGADEFLNAYDPTPLLLYETRPLSASTRQETLKHSFSYYPDDLVVIHMDNAFIIDPSGSFDVPDMLEFANAQIFELRYFDNVIDKELKWIYGELSGKGGASFLRLREYERLAKKITRIITELTEVTERVNNSLKVTEDIYYARIYRTFMAILGSKDWEASIGEKLGIVTNTYKMLHEEIALRRGYTLELGIFVLIALEIILVLTGK